jgi:hypothetical protein
VVFYIQQQILVGHRFLFFPLGSRMVMWRAATSHSNNAALKAAAPH